MMWSIVEWRLRTLASNRPAHRNGNGTCDPPTVFSGATLKLIGVRGNRRPKTIEPMARILDRRFNIGPEARAKNCLGETHYERVAPVTFQGGAISGSSKARLPERKST